MKLFKDEKKLALVISGDALTCMKEITILNRIMEIAEQCETVIGCRVSPKQKEEIVLLVKLRVLIKNF